MRPVFDQQAFDAFAEGARAEDAQLPEQWRKQPERLERHIQRHRRFYNYIVCCGHKLYVPDFTNTCATCKADYNWAGQRLAPRSQWGEETGEHPSDIENIR